MPVELKALMLFLLGLIILRVSLIIAYSLFGMSITEIIKEMFIKED